jgi:hypothetical protein
VAQTANALPSMRTADMNSSLAVLVV